jgi:tripartite-type tricarboxylate transporter receptor subunit TctC
MIGPTVAVLPLAQAGKIRALAVASAKRSALAPELPTRIESGVAGFEVNSWYGLAAPAGTPKAVIARLNAETNKTLQTADVIEQFRVQGYEPLGGTPEAMNAQIRDDVARWTRIIRDAGIQPQ